MTRILILLAFLLCASPLYAADINDEADQVMNLVRRTYSNLKTIKTPFIQTEERPGVGVSLQEEGTLSFLLPDMMRWDYEGEKPHRVVINGNLVWIYSPSRNQVIRREMTPEEMRQGAATFLRGLEDLERDFTVRSTGDGSESRYLLELNPISEMTPYERIGVAISRETGIIERLSIHHRIGNLTTIVFSNIETDVKLSKDLFAWDVPEGTEIIEP